MSSVVTSQINCRPLRTAGLSTTIQLMSELREQYLDQENFTAAISATETNLDKTDIKL